MSTLRHQLRAALSTLGDKDVAMQSEIGVTMILQGLQTSQQHQEVLSEILNLHDCNMLAMKGRLREAALVLDRSTLTTRMFKTVLQGLMTAANASSTSSLLPESSAVVSALTTALISGRLDQGNTDSSFVMLQQLVAQCLTAATSGSNERSSFLYKVVHTVLENTAGVATVQLSLAKACLHRLLAVSASGWKSVEIYGLAQQCVAILGSSLTGKSIKAILGRCINSMEHQAGWQVSCQAAETTSTVFGSLQLQDQHTPSAAWSAIKGLKEPLLNALAGLRYDRIEQVRIAATACLEKVLHALSHAQQQAGPPEHHMSERVLTSARPEPSVPQYPFKRPPLRGHTKADLDFGVLVFTPSRPLHTGQAQQQAGQGDGLHSKQAVIPLGDKPEDYLKQDFIPVYSVQNSIRSPGEIYNQRQESQPAHYGGSQPAGRSGSMDFKSLLTSAPQELYSTPQKPPHYPARHDSAVTAAVKRPATSRASSRPGTPSSVDVRRLKKVQWTLVKLTEALSHSIQEAEAHESAAEWKSPKSQPRTSLGVSSQSQIDVSRSRALQFGKHETDPGGMLRLMEKESQPSVVERSCDEDPMLQQIDLREKFSNDEGEHHIQDAGIGVALHAVRDAIDDALDSAKSSELELNEVDEDLEERSMDGESPVRKVSTWLNGNHPSQHDKDLPDSRSSSPVKEAEHIPLNGSGDFDGLQLRQDPDGNSCRLSNSREVLDTANKADNCDWSVPEEIPALGWSTEAKRSTLPDEPQDSVLAESPVRQAGGASIPRPLQPPEDAEVVESLETLADSPMGLGDVLDFETIQKQDQTALFAYLKGSMAFGNTTSKVEQGQSGISLPQGKAWGSNPGENSSVAPGNPAGVQRTSPFQQLAHSQSGTRSAVSLSKQSLPESGGLHGQSGGTSRRASTSSAIAQKDEASAPQAVLIKDGEHSGPSLKHRSRPSSGRIPKPAWADSTRSSRSGEGERGGMSSDWIQKPAIDAREEELPNVQATVDLDSHSGLTSPERGLPRTRNSATAGELVAGSHSQQGMRPTTDIHCNPLFTARKQRDMARRRAVDRVTQLHSGFLTSALSRASTDSACSFPSVAQMSHCSSVHGTPVKPSLPLPQRPAPRWSSTSASGNEAPPADRAKEGYLPGKQPSTFWPRNHWATAAMPGGKDQPAGGPSLEPRARKVAEEIPPVVHRQADYWVYGDSRDSIPAQRLHDSEDQGPQTVSSEAWRPQNWRRPETRPVEEVFSQLDLTRGSSITNASDTSSIQALQQPPMQAVAWASAPSQSVSPHRPLNECPIRQGASRQDWEVDGSEAKWQAKGVREHIKLGYMEGREAGEVRPKMYGLNKRQRSLLARMSSSRSGDSANLSSSVPTHERNMKQRTHLDSPPERPFPRTKLAKISGSGLDSVSLPHENDAELPNVRQRPLLALHTKRSSPSRIQESQIAPYPASEGTPAAINDGEGQGWFKQQASRLEEVRLQREGSASQIVMDPVEVLHQFQPCTRFEETGSAHDKASASMQFFDHLAQGSTAKHSSNQIACSRFDTDDLIPAKHRGTYTPEGSQPLTAHASSCTRFQQDNAAPQAEFQVKGKTAGPLWMDKVRLNANPVDIGQIRSPSKVAMRMAKRLADGQKNSLSIQRQANHRSTAQSNSTGYSMLFDSDEFEDEV